jgi:MFS transporter, PHS family, inorganic phosphate transporter
MQLVGFMSLTILLIIFGFGYEPIKKASIGLFITIFTLVQFFFSFGPNITTFIIPGEVFPKKYRSTAYGISAAAGKLGAIVSSGKHEKIQLIQMIFHF